MEISSGEDGASGFHHTKLSINGGMQTVARPEPRYPNLSAKTGMMAALVLE